MRPAHVVEITTPKKYFLNGLWLGPEKAKRVIIFVHGLSGSVFGASEKRLCNAFIDEDTAVLSFNNRGHDIISKLYKEVPRSKKGYTSITAGAAHEIFVDCVDDIEGAVQFVSKQGVKEVFLAGHSTGCQKSIYWAHKKQKSGIVKGIILLAPVSDYAAASLMASKEELAAATKVARSLVLKDKHQLMPTNIWPETIDAQRFLSLYTPESIEEVFSYHQEKKNPKVLKSVQIPTLIFIAENDEHMDRSAETIATWFAANTKALHTVHIIPKVMHSFRGGESAIAGIVEQWAKSLMKKNS